MISRFGMPATQLHTSRPEGETKQCRRQRLIGQSDARDQRRSEIARRRPARRPPGTSPTGAAKIQTASRYKIA